MLATKHAAIIGIDAYGSGIAPLKSAVADARAVADVLARDHGYSSRHLLLDGQATGAAILILLEEMLPAVVDARGAVVLYYAGHGVALGDGSEGPEGFLLPQDAQSGDESTWLSMERVRKALSRLACKHLLVVLDCCFAGSFRWASSRSFVPVGRPLYDSQYARFLAGTAWQSLTSASHQETAPDVTPGCRNLRDGGTGNGHSPFAAALLKGLAGEADSGRGRHEPDGVITATELHQYIFEELVPRGVRPRQTPGIWPLKPENTGEFLFLVPGREKKTRPDPPLDDANNPWLGLKAYGRKDAALFFGRERVVEEVLGRILDPSRPPLLAVVGASGTGKSSVVRAGVLPRLEKPPEELAGKTGVWTVARLPRLQGDPRLQLDQALGKLTENHPDRRRLLFIDQFEELYTQCEDGEVREGFLRRLREMMTGEAPLKVVITLRSDFEPRLAASEELREFLAPARYLVPAMTSEEFRDVIEEPAKAKALYFESEALVGDLVDEVMAMPGGLPLLSFALSEMYRQAQIRRRKTGALDRALTREDYKAAGGVVGALHRRANELYEAADSQRQETIRRLFLRMVSQEGGRLARRRVEERELEYADAEEQGRVRQVLNEYVAARLLVADEGYVEPAHDTLVLAWDKLLGWLTESGSQELVRQLWSAASAWDAARHQKGDKDAAGLLWNQDPRLPLVQDHYLGRPRPWRSRLRTHGVFETPSQPGELNRLEREFAERSVARKRSRRNLVAGITAAVILALSGTTWYALDRAREAENATAEAVKSAEAEKKASATAEARRIEAEQERGKAQAKQKEAEDAKAAADKSAIAEREAKKTAQRSAVAEREAREEAEKKRREAEAAAVAERLARQRAQDTARAAVAGEWLKRDPTRAALAMLEVETPSKTAYAVARLQEALAEPLSGAVLRHQSEVSSATFSPDGQHVVTGSADGTVRVWAADGSSEPIVLRGHLDAVMSVAFSPDGKSFVTASRDKTARVWAADGSRERVVLRGHEGWLWSAAFSPDGRRIVTASWDKTARIWPSDGSAEPVILQGHQDTVRSAEFSPDGRQIVTASWDGTAQVWPVDGFGKPVVLKGHAGWVLSAAFSPDGRRIVTSSMDRTARIWPTEGSAKPVVLRHDDVPHSAVFSPDGQMVLTGSSDSTARVWPAGGFGKEVILRGHQGLISGAVFSPDGQRVLTTSYDRTARIWLTDGSGEPIVLRGHEDWVTSAAFSRDGRRIVTASNDNTARVWSTDSSSEPLVLSGHGGRVLSASLSHDGIHLVTTSDDNLVRVWATNGSSGPVVLRGHEGKVSGAAFSPDGRRVVTTSVDKTARVWSADGSGEPIVLKGHTEEVVRASFSSDGLSIVTASWDGTARIWPADGSGKPAIVLQHDHGTIESAAFSPDGRRVVTTSLYGLVQVWTADGSGEPVILRGFRGGVWSAAFSPDGRRIALASQDQMGWVWAADGSGEPVVLKGHTSDVRGIAFSPDGQRIVTTSDDKTARVWQADGSGDPMILRGHQDVVGRAAFSPDGKSVVTTSWDGTARIWSIEENLLQARLRRATTVCLEPEFRVTYLGESDRDATAIYQRCRRCIEIWNRQFNDEVIRASSDEAWAKWQQCMSQ